MATIVLLRGANVGGNRVFRPAQLPAKLKKFDVVNIGAAGTFVVREKASRDAVIVAFRKVLPFETEIITCTDEQILDLIEQDPFAKYRILPDMTRFVSVLSAEPEVEPLLPVEFAHEGKWLLKVVERVDQFALGIYRRHMKTITFLGRVDKLFDVTVTTRNWNTIGQIAKVLRG